MYIIIVTRIGLIERNIKMQDVIKCKGAGF